MMGYGRKRCGNIAQLQPPPGDIELMSIAFYQVGTYTILYNVWTCSDATKEQTVQGNIAIKGTRNGLLLTLEPDTSFSTLLQALAERLAEAPSFFQGASLSVDTSRRGLLVSERLQLEDLLARYYMSIVPLEQSPAQHKEARTITLPLEEASPVSRPSFPDTSIVDLTQLREARESRQGQDTSSFGQGEPEPRNVREMRDPRESDDTLFVRRTIRSGQAIRHHSNVIVLGDVNHGAEIIAGGDIIVWGVLRGMVHAGYPDNQNALVCSLLLSPVQLRIAHLLSRPPEGFEAQALPEVASIKEGRIIVETWTNGRGPRK